MSRARATPGHTSGVTHPGSASGRLPVVGGRIAGFVLEAPLGAGAMGQVFRARDEALGRVSVGR